MKLLSFSLRDASWKTADASVSRRPNTRQSQISRRSTTDSDATLIGQEDAHISFKNTIPEAGFQLLLPKKRKEKKDGYSVSFQSVLQTSITVGEATNIPYLKGLAGIVLVIWNAVQSTKDNMEFCCRLEGMVLELVEIASGFQNKKDDQLSSSSLLNVESLRTTLDQIISALVAHSKRKYFVRFVNAVKDRQLLDNCEKALEHALGVFLFRTAVSTAATMQKTEDMERLQHEEYHEALVDIKESIEAAVDSPTTPIVNDLPLMPQVFHGRDTELTHLVNIFANHENAGHAVIGGQPGVGKSSLAHALLHQEDVVSLYGTNRFYIDCTDASALVDVTSRLKAFLGLSDNLKDHWDLFDSLSNLIGRCLIVLDNLETIWEPSSSRLVFEDFLTQLSDVTTVSLLVTLRGTQRPLGPRWSFSTHVLSPLDPTSAKATFLAISDLPDDPDIDTLLSQIDFLPLPLTIMAHLAQYEPISFLLDRYKEEGTAILSTGNDRTTDLDTSVEISLTSSRITECPSSLLVLRALAQSENGIMRTRVAASVSGISLVQKCISTLIASALVLEDSEGCIRVPSPIRVYLSTHGD